MTDGNNNERTPTQAPLTADERSSAVIDVENLIGDYTQQDILCILLTVTVNAIHVVEDKADRKRIEEGYVHALRFLSAVEEEFHGEIVGEPPDWADKCVSAMIRHIFGAIAAS